MAFQTLVQNIKDPKNRGSFWAAAAGFVCVASAALLARIAGDTLFLTTYGRNSLAFIYLGTAIVVSLLSAAFGILITRYAVHRLLASAAAFIVLLVLIVRLGLEFDIRAVKIGAYLLADLTVHGTMILFWTYFGNLFDSRKAKSFIGPVGAAGTIGCMVSAFLVKPFTAEFGIENLLGLVAALVAGFAVVVIIKPPAMASAPSPAPAKSLGLRNRFQILKNPGVRKIALLVSTATVTITIVDFQFKAGAQNTLTPEALAGFFGQFYTWANVVVLIIQLFVVGWLLRRGGLLISLSLLPGFLLVTSIGTFFGPEFFWIVASRFVVQSFMFTVDTAALHVLFMSFRKQSYGQARAFVDGICKPMAIGTTGSLLFLASSWISLTQVALAVAIVAGIWLYLARVNFKTYIHSLVEGLRAKRIYATEQPDAVIDKSFVENARRRILTAPPEDLPYLFSLFEEYEGLDLSNEIRALLDREDSQSKVIALEKIRARNRKVEISSIRGLISHPDPNIRREAVRTISSIGGPSVVEPVLRAIEDPDPGVRAEAATAFLKRENPESQSLGVVLFEKLVNSTDPLQRIAAAGPLSRSNLSHRSILINQLLRDRDSQVIAAALEACQKHPDSGQIPDILTHIKNPELRSFVVENLVAAGEGTLSFFEKLDPDEMERIFEESPILAFVIGRIGGARSLDLIRRLTKRDFLSPSIAECYRKLMRESEESEAYGDEIQKLILSRIDRIHELEGLLIRSVDEPYAEFLTGSLMAGIDSSLETIFILLEIQTSEIDMHMLRLKVKSKNPEHRNSALEILENLLPSYIKRDLINILEKRQNLYSQDLQTPAGSEIAGVNQEQPAMSHPNLNEAAVKTDFFDPILLEEFSPSVLAGAIYASARNSISECYPRIPRFLDHHNPIVRETALKSVWLLAPDSSWKESAYKLLTDRDLLVRRLAQSMARQDSEGVPMITLEKVLFLKNVPLFSQLSSPELSSIARITHEEVFPAGDQIINEGEMGSSMYLIVDGEVLVHQGEKHLRTLGTNTYFGEMAILDGEARSASVRAVTDCHLLSIYQRDFNDLIAQHPTIASAVIATLNERLRNTLDLLQRDRK